MKGKAEAVKALLEAGWTIEEAYNLLEVRATESKLDFQKLDELSQRIRKLADYRRTLIAQTPDPVNDLIGISNDVSNARMSALGL